MLQPEKTHPSAVGFPLPDCRAMPRWPCPDHPPIDLMVRPHCGSIPARVRDISRHGIGLNCLKPISPGTNLLLLVKPEGRLVKAKVVHATPDLDGWQVGCLLAQSLTDDELAAYVAQDF
jgi:hypothetical protein